MEFEVLEEMGIRFTVDAGDVHEQLDGVREKADEAGEALGVAPGGEEEGGGGGGTGLAGIMKGTRAGFGALARSIGGAEGKLVGLVGQVGRVVTSMNPFNALMLGFPALVMGAAKALDYLTSQSLREAQERFEAATKASEAFLATFDKMSPVEIARQKLSEQEAALEGLKEALGGTGEITKRLELQKQIDAGEDIVKRLENQLRLEIESEASTKRKVEWMAKLSHAMSGSKSYGAEKKPGKEEEPWGFAGTYDEGKQSKRDQALINSIALTEKDRLATEEATSEKIGAESHYYELMIEEEERLADVREQAYRDQMDRIQMYGSIAMNVVGIFEGLGNLVAKNEKQRTAIKIAAIVAEAVIQASMEAAKAIASAAEYDYPAAALHATAAVQFAVLGAVNAASAAAGGGGRGGGGSSASARGGASASSTTQPTETKIVIYLDGENLEGWIVKRTEQRDRRENPTKVSNRL
jgi:hypothetical protein